MQMVMIALKNVVEIKNKYTNKKITFEFVLVYPPNKAEVHVDVLNEEGKKYPNGNINIPLDEIITIRSIM